MLITAAGLALSIAVAHSWLGERYIISRLLRLEKLPRLFGDDSFTRQTIRFGWHLTTVAWVGLAAVLMMLSGVFPALQAGSGILSLIAATFFFSALLAWVFTRGRHLSWVVFLAIAALCILASI